LRTGWQVLPKGPAADEERGRTPDLISDESAPNCSARTPWVHFSLLVYTCTSYYFKYRYQWKLPWKKSATFHGNLFSWFFAWLLVDETNLKTQLIIRLHLIPQSICFAGSTKASYKRTMFAIFFYRLNVMILQAHSHGYNLTSSNHDCSPTFLLWEVDSLTTI
jgi:hypothetical protein